MRRIGKWVAILTVLLLLITGCSAMLDTGGEEESLFVSQSSSSISQSKSQSLKSQSASVSSEASSQKQSSSSRSASSSRVSASSSVVSSVAPTPSVAPSVAPTTPSETMVWVTSSGKKYHSTSSCSNMKSPTQMTKSAAINSGRGACSKCW